MARPGGLAIVGSGDRQDRRAGRRPCPCPCPMPEHVGNLIDVGEELLADGGVGGLLHLAGLVDGIPKS